MVEEKPHPMEKPIPILDIPCLSPQLNFETYAEVIAWLLTNANPPQMTVGIFGGYGSGKTTLMNAIARALQRITNQESLLMVSFNAWRHEHEEHLFLPLLKVIHQNAQGDPSVRECVLTALLAFIRGMSLKFSNVEILAHKVTESVDALLGDNLSRVLMDYTDIYDALGRLPLNEEGIVERSIVVFIDDLDRCLPHKAFALLEALKSFMDTRGFMFVLGLDPRAVKSYITAKYGKDFVQPEEYLQKMFQVPFHLPRPTTTDVCRTLADLLKKRGDSWAHGIQLQLQNNDELMAFLPRNIRQVKRILNMHQVITHAHGRLNARLLLGLLIVQVRWPLAYRLLQSFPQNFHGVLSACYQGNLRRVPEEIQKSHEAMATFRDHELFHLFDKLILEETGHHTVDGILPYLELMGWPVDIKAKWNPLGETENG